MTPKLFLRIILIPAILSGGMGLVRTGLQAQGTLESLTGPGRPRLANPKEFAYDLYAKAHSLVRARLGEEAYNRMVDTVYEYPWYFHNVYFNSAPSEMNYRVAFWLNRGRADQYSFEWAFDTVRHEPVFPLDKALPACGSNPGLCSLIPAETALVLAKTALGSGFLANGEAGLFYDTLRQCFAWGYFVSEMVRYPHGKTGQVYLEAHTGRIYHRDVQTEVWMGRCLPPEARLETPQGWKAIHTVRCGDRVRYGQIDNKPQFFKVIQTTRKAVKAAYPMVKIRWANGSSLVISGNHPQPDGNPFDRLRPGDFLGETQVLETGLFRFSGPFTYDILTDEPLGRYEVEGIPCGSTLVRATQCPTAEGGD